jgi:hypothetical protein
LSTPVLSLAQGGPAAGHPLWHFGLVAGAGLVTFVGIKGAERWKQAGRQLHRPSGPMVVLALLGLASSLIHALVGREHFREWVVYGLFFVCASALQAAWSILLLAHPSRSLLVLGAIGNAAVVSLFLISRTVGIPFGPDSFQPEALDGFGIAATGCEVAVLIGASWLLSASRRATVRIVALQGL